MEERLIVEAVLVAIQGYDMKNPFKTNKNLPNPNNLQDPTAKYYVDVKTINLVPISELDNDSIVRNN